jgi:polyisoprenoid-binding protein YceI
MTRIAPYILVVASLVGVAADAATWTVADGSEVVFTSKAPMESFDGRTDQVTGHLTCDPANLRQPVDLRMVVDLASLDTGIGLRNDHMRKNHLETDTYPEAVFTGGTVADCSAQTLAPGAPVDLTLVGTFDLHGVAREMTIPATVTMSEAGDLTVTASFQVKLSDHEIKRPKFLVMKLADEQAVTIDLALRREGSS